MVKPNYRQQKRQKEISKKARHDEKMLKRSARLQGTGTDEQPGGDAGDGSVDATQTSAETAAPDASGPATTV